MKDVMKEWNSPAPTLGLAMTASCLAMWGQNWHMYTWASLGISLALVAGLGLLFLLLVGRLARVCGPPAPKWLAWLLWLLIGWLLVEILMILLDAPAGELAVSLGLKKTRYLKIPLALAVFPAVYFARGFRLLNSFLLVWLLVSLGGGLVNVWSAPEGKIAEAGFQVTLKKKPDIFIYFLESYHSPYAMRLLYGHDAGPMVEYLRGKNFLIYDRTLSNSNSTLPSMADVFTMRPSFHLARGNSDVMPTVRRAIGGSDDNHLFKILKDNGYHTTFLTMDSPYYFQDQGSNLDTSDIDVGYYGHWLVRNRNLLPLYDLNLYKFRSLTTLYVAPPGEFEFKGTLPERVRQAAERGQKHGSPFLVCFLGGAAHPTLGSPREFEAWKPVYLDLVAEADKEIKEIVEFLDEAAPDAMVILVGDHGAKGYRVISPPPARPDYDEVWRRLTERNLTVEAAVQDAFGTLLAIRLPGGEQRDISFGLALNHVNLFRHLFACLNDDPDILKTREEPSLSRFSDLILGRDNRPVFERYKSDQAEAKP